MTSENYRLSYLTLISIGIFHVGAGLAVFYYETRFLALALLIWMVSHGIGLAVGYHRLLTHGGFKTPKLVEYLITLCGNLSLQGSHVRWVALHRKHHQFTELPGDPHSPRHGFLHAHMGWMIFTDADNRSQQVLHKYAKDLMSQPFHRFLDRWWWLPSVGLAIVLYAWGGLGAVLWCIFVPVAVGLQFTWLVNSVCHRWGSRMFETNDDSKNHWLVALLTWGEGWHNNHHDKPTRARHGLTWYQIDPGWIFIRFLAAFGLAKSIKL